MTCGGRFHEKEATDELLWPAGNHFATLKISSTLQSTSADAPTPLTLSDLPDHFLQWSGQTTDIRYKRLSLPGGPRLTLPKAWREWSQGEFLSTS